MTLIDSLPICSANKRDFYDELRTPSPDGLKIKTSLSKSYECDAFEKWTPGIGPKELQEMKLLEEQRRWQAKQARRERRWRREDVQLAKNAMKVNVRSYLVAAVIGFIGALAAVALARLLKS